MFARMGRMSLEHGTYKKNESLSPFMSRVNNCLPNQDESFLRYRQSHCLELQEKRTYTGTTAHNAAHNDAFMITQLIIS